MTSNVNKYGNWWDNHIAQQILSKKYFHKEEVELADKHGFDNAFKAFVGRVSGIFSTKELKDFMHDSLVNGDFILAGRSLYAAGAKDKFKASMSNCYIMPSPEDNIESIFDTCGKMGRIFSYGGGCGINISKLRPRDAIVLNSAKTSTGAVSFMDVFNVVGEVIGSNNRRAALLIALNCEHPDIEEFLDVKKNNDKIQAANISICFTNDFMEAVEKNQDFTLEFNVDATGERITKIINARDFFMKFCESQYDWAEPAALWIDKINNWNILDSYPRNEYNIEVTNPCAEFASNAYNSCNLASINLYNFVEEPFTDKAYFDFIRFRSVVKKAIQAMDEVLDYGYDMQPLDENRKNIEDWRSLGLGVFGVADMLVAMGIEYGSSGSIDLIKSIMRTMQKHALYSSAMLAKDKGTFKKYDYAKVRNSNYLRNLFNNEWDNTADIIQKYGLRNSTLLSIAPTGSIAMLFNQSGGVEPYYQLSYDRTTHALEKEGKKFHIAMLGIQHLLMHNDITEELSNEEIKERFHYVVDTYDINPRSRVNMQAAMQECVDNAISSTINLKEDATVQEIFDLYMHAWETGCKGITIFRDNCKRISILGKDHGVSTESLKNQEKCDEKALKCQEKCDDNPKCQVYPEKTIQNQSNDVEKTVILNSVTPIKRSDGIDSLWGRTFVFHTACVPKFYVTVNIKDGEIFEVFVAADKGCQANISTLTRMTSLCLRSGVKVDEVVKNLNSAICAACTNARNKGDIAIAKSCASCIATAITEMQKTLHGGKKRNNPAVQELEVVKEVPKGMKMIKVASNAYSRCPECGANALVPDGKCVFCNNCGYSKC